MPHITNETVTKKRKEIKKAFPNWKFSITKRHHSTLCVDILEADIKLTEQDNQAVNHYYIKDHFQKQPEVRDALQKIANIMLEGEKVISHDGDYGNIPNFYVSLGIGQWNRPFVYKPKV